MSTILTRSYAGIQDNRAILSNDSICRPFFAGNWNKIRVCARLSINGSASIVGTSPHFALGFSSGPTVFNGATSQFVGIITWVGIGGSFLYNAGPPKYFSTRYYVGAKVGTTIYGTTGNYTDVNNSYATNSYMSVYETAGAPMRDLMFATIARPGGVSVPTSGLYEVCMFVRSSNSNFNDASAANFTTQAIASTPVHVLGTTNNSNYGIDFAPGGMYLAGTGKIQIDELSHSPLNHVMVGWDQSSATIEVSDIGVVKLL